MKLRTRLSLTFGFLATLGTLIASYMIFTQMYFDLEALTADRLRSIATLLSRSVDPLELSKYRKPGDWFIPGYQRLKRKLMDFQRANGMSWVALYRFDGSVFRAIADGSEQGDSFCTDFPIYDVSENMSRAWAGETGLVSIYTDAYGTYLMANSPVMSSDGSVAAIVDVSLSASKLTEARSKVINRTVALSLAVIFLTVLVSFIVSSRLARPVRLLEIGARELATGNLEYRVEQKSGSSQEIEYLTAIFNEMASELLRSQNALKMRITELGTLCELSRELSFAPNVETVVDSILKKILETTECAGVAFLTRDDGDGPALNHFVAAPGHDVEDFLGMAPAETPEVAEALADGSVRISRIRDKNAGQRHFFVVPVRSEDKVPAVVVGFGKPEQSDETAPHFSDTNLHFIETVAGHLGLVLEKIRLYELAITDGLTGLFVHRYFQGALERELIRAKRYGTETSLLLFDIDHFKKFNDTYGHQMGDVVIAEVAGIVRGTIRDNLDIASRYGGEEFTVILPETATKQAFFVAERLRHAVEAHNFRNGDTVVKVTISIGVSTFPVHSMERLELIRLADEALYRSKEGGRNKTTVWENFTKI